MLRIRAIASALCVVSIVACGGSGGDSGTGYNTAPTGGNNNPPPTTTPPSNDPIQTTAVTLTTSSFMPGNISVAKGSTVTWTWDTCSNDPYGYGGTTCVPHNIAFDDGMTSSEQSTGTYTRKFDVTGTFKYHCLVHGPAMSGQVVVQ